MKSLQDVLDRIHETTDFEDVSPMAVNSKGLFDNTPLHVTITWGDTESAALLLDGGADVNAKGEYGFTPLHRAISANKPALIKLLLECGADPTIRNADGDDCFALARKLGVEHLLNRDVPGRL